MKTLAVLAREHGTIESMAQRFEVEIARIPGGEEVDAEALERLLGFFELEVDGHHQEKEERVFLPRLLLRAPSEEARALRGLLDDHRAQRQLLAGMRGEIEGVAYGDGGALNALLHNARRYLTVQREHSRWEGARLFPLARLCLSRRDDHAICRGFRRLETNHGHALWDAAAALVAWLELRRAPASA
ncbi:MAG: hypothetical protein EXS08_13780 [Planctomycetes bacterium]|nr:hypothetical protein [Planctomycetota bacterium]